VILRVNIISIPLYSVNGLMFVMVMGCVLFEVRTEYLNTIDNDGHVNGVRLRL
jgi:hypothetical protein